MPARAQSSTSHAAWSRAELHPQPRATTAAVAKLCQLPAAAPPRPHAGRTRRAAWSWAELYSKPRAAAATAAEVCPPHCHARTRSARTAWGSAPSSAPSPAPAAHPASAAVLVLAPPSHGPSPRRCRSGERGEGGASSSALRREQGRRGEGGRAGDGGGWRAGVGRDGRRRRRTARYRGEEGWGGKAAR